MEEQTFHESPESLRGVVEPRRGLPQTLARSPELFRQVLCVAALLREREPNLPFETPKRLLANN